MVIKERLKPNGKFHLELEKKDGVRKCIDDHNLVVEAGRSMLAKMVTGELTDTIKYLGVGTGKNAETGEDTALTDEVRIELATRTASGTTATFSFVIGYEICNGMDIHEFALVSDSGTLFSRRMREASLTKQSDIQITGYWEVTF